MRTLRSTGSKQRTTGGDERLSTTKYTDDEPAEQAITIGEAAAILGFSVKSLQRWDKAGKFPAHRTPAGRRYYLRSELGNALKRAA